MIRYINLHTTAGILSMFSPLVSNDQNTVLNSSCLEYEGVSETPSENCHIMPSYSSYIQLTCHFVVCICSRHSTHCYVHDAWCKAYPLTLHLDRPVWYSLCRHLPDMTIVCGWTVGLSMTEYVLDWTSFVKPNNK